MTPNLERAREPETVAPPELLTVTNPDSVPVSTLGTRSQENQVPGSSPTTIPTRDPIGAEQDQDNSSSDRQTLNEPVPTPTAFDGRNSNALTLGQVLDSVESSFPSLIAAYLEQQVAAGNVVASQGEFDLNLKGETNSNAIGFYENNYGGLKATQPIFNNGGSIYSGYKFGRGSFEPWFKELEKDKGGEFAIGAVVPLLKNRAIDSRRADLFLAQFDLAAVEPFIRQQRNEICRDAAMAFWKWMTAGLTLQIQNDLIQLAQQRAKQIATLVQAGDLPELAQIDNDRLLAARRTKLIETERKFQEAGIKLSLYLRNEAGEIVLPDQSMLPADFPELAAIDAAQIDGDIQFAISNRPETTEIALEIRKLEVELARAENSCLPKLDALVEASQDMGAAASAAGDKSPYEMQFGLAGEVPWQRRYAAGKIASLRNKLQQVRVKQQFLQNKITTEVQDAYSAMIKAVERIEQARQNRDLAKRSRDIAEAQFAEGDIDLIVLNIYEQSVADAQLAVLESDLEYHSARANYLAAIGRNR